MSRLKISKIHTHSMRNNLHFQFHTEFKQLLDRAGAGMVRLAALIAEFGRRYQALDDAFKVIAKSAITKHIQDADRARDTIWRGLTAANSAALKHFDAAVCEAARQIKIVFDTYGDVARLPLHEQTSAVYNLLQDLEGKQSANVEVVGLTPWVAQLKATNLAFDALVKGRFDEVSLKGDVAVKKARADVDASYRDIVDAINVLAMLDGLADYETFIRSHNAVISNYAAQIAIKTGKAKAKKAAGAQWEEEDEAEDYGEEDEQTG